MADKELNEMETEVVETEVESTSDKSGKKAKNSKKKGFFAKIGSLLKRFWKTMKSELHKVTWFSRKQTYSSTLLVLVVMAVAAIVIGLLDVGLSQLLEIVANNVNFIK